MLFLILLVGKQNEKQSKPFMKKGAMYVTAVGDRQYMSMDRVLTCSEFCGSWYVVSYEMLLLLLFL